MEKVVHIALVDFVNGANKYSVDLHQLDKASAVDLFETLMQGGIKFDPAEVVSWLVGVHGWNTPKAKKIGSIAQKAKEGRRQQCIRRIFGPDALARWLTKAGEH